MRRRDAKVAAHHFGQLVAELVEGTVRHLGGPAFQVDVVQTLFSDQLPGRRGPLLRLRVEFVSGSCTIVPAMVFLVRDNSSS